MSSSSVDTLAVRRLLKSAHMTTTNRFIHAATVGLFSLVGGCTPSAPALENSLDIEFNPIFSGYDGVHTFQVPTTIANASVSGITDVQWSTDSPSLVDLQLQSDNITTMITTKGAGTAHIIAKTDDAEGETTITITSFTPDQWTTGQTRYNSGAVLMHGSGAGSGSADQDKYVQCTSCHDASAQPGSVGSDDTGPTIEHTPEQTGGFADTQLEDIYMMGILPDSDANPIHMSPQRFMSFHQWQASPDEETGLLCYLRSLTPKSQGQFDYGGHGGGGGGSGGGGGGGGGGSGSGSGS
jgi:hypothetical protein